jgi:Right handed beta helix region
MSRITSLLFAATLLALGLGSGSAQAQSRVFVGGQGSDSNSCSATSPCRTFQHAHDVAAANGEIDVLSPAGYGPLTITKAISIQGHGFSGLTVSNGLSGIVITAGPSDNINLSGLIIDGAGVGTDGVHFNSGKSLTIDSCLVRNLAGTGISFVPTTSSTLAVSSTIVSNNGISGIVVRPSGNNLLVRAVFNRVETNNNAQNGIGVFGDNTTGSSLVRASTVDGVAAYNNANGLYVFGINGVTSFSVFRSNIFSNAVGLRAESGASMFVSQSNLEDNVVSLNAPVNWSDSNGSGFLHSYGDNYTRGVAVPNNTPIGKN